MTKKILLVADLGHFKAYRFEESRQFSRPRLALFHEWQSSEVNHLVDEVTDRAGQFRKGSFPTGPSETSDGETHNLFLERRRKSLRAVAKLIDKIVQRRL